MQQIVSAVQTIVKEDGAFELVYVDQAPLPRYGYDPDGVAFDLDGVCFEQCSAEAWFNWRRPGHRWARTWSFASRAPTCDSWPRKMPGGAQGQCDE